MSLETLKKRINSRICQKILHIKEIEKILEREQGKLRLLGYVLTDIESLEKGVEFSIDALENDDCKMEDDGMERYDDIGKSSYGH